VIKLEINRFGASFETRIHPVLQPEIMVVKLDGPLNSVVLDGRKIGLLVF